MQTLYTLPAEIINEICSHLKLPDIRTLRLTSHSVLALVADTFHRYLTKKTIEWTNPNQLDKLMQMTKVDQPGRYIQHLVILGQIGVRTTEGDHEQAKTKLLESFKNLSAIPGRNEGFSITVDVASPYVGMVPEWVSGVAGVKEDKVGGTNEEILAFQSSLPMLASRSPQDDDSDYEFTDENDGSDNGIFLDEHDDSDDENYVPEDNGNSSTSSNDVDIPEDNNDGYNRPLPSHAEWSDIWRMAKDTFQVTIAAMAQSGVKFTSFSIFPHLDSCSLSCEQLGFALAEHITSLSIMLKSLKSLSLNVSHSKIYKDDDHDGHDDDPIISRTGYIGTVAALQIVLFIRQCQDHLEELTLRFYRLDSALGPTRYQDKERLFFHRMSSLSFPRLKSLILRGMYTSSHHLLTFLQSHPNMTRLTLQEVHLNVDDEADTWDAIFNHITDNMQLGYLYLDDLWAGRVLHFLARGRPKFFANGEVQLPTYLLRTEERTRWRIECMEVETALGDEDCMKWIKMRGLRYGPPRYRQIDD